MRYHVGWTGEPVDRDDALPFQYAFLCSGDSAFIRNAAVPFADAVEDALGSTFLLRKSNSEAHLVAPPRLMADAGTTFAVGFIAFVAGWAAEKFLDEIYELKFQPVLRAWLQRADQVVVFGAKRSRPAFVSAIQHEDIGVTVVILFTAATYADLADTTLEAARLHHGGLEWALDNPGAAPVQLWAVQDGATPTAPREFETLDHALGSLPPNTRIQQTRRSKA